VAKAVEIGVVDEIITPAKTRTALAAALYAATPTRGDHGNIPL
jgi:acetyl-CoA/propionyl-CoA carboxylase carboxyl transferase subunit